MMLLHCLSQPAASIWFEIWEVADPGLKKSNFPGKFMKNFDFFHAISSNIQFFQANFRKISILSGNVTKNSTFQAKLAIYSNFWENYSISLQK